MSKMFLHFGPKRYYVSICRDLPHVFKKSRGIKDEMSPPTLQDPRNARRYTVACCSTPPPENTTTITTATTSTPKSWEFGGASLLSESAALGRGFSWSHSGCFRTTHHFSTEWLRKHAWLSRVRSGECRRAIRKPRAENKTTPLFATTCE